MLNSVGIKQIRRKGWLYLNVFFRCRPNEGRVCKMIKYPVGIQSFEKIRKENYLYIDKTGYIYDLVRNYQYVFLSRPRRFGKSLLTSTLECYFRGKKDLFSGLDIGSLETEWNQYPVLHFSLDTAALGTCEDTEDEIGLQLSEMEHEYGMPDGGRNITVRFQKLVVGLFNKTGRQVVVLIDEYDVPVLSVRDDERREDMRALMKSFYSPIKRLDRYLRFVFITGITKFSQLSIFSQINNLEAISMDPSFATICGITEAELEKHFSEGISAMAEKFNITSSDILDRLRKKYDGYHFAQGSSGVYNPFSLLSSMKKCSFANYWFETGTPHFLISQLKKFHTDITQIDGSQADAREFDAPTDDMHSILPLLYQSGYLTIKDYDRSSLMYTLGYPNEEVKLGLTEVLIPYYVWSDINQSDHACWAISNALICDDIDKALKAAQKYFSSIPYQEGTLRDAPSTEGHFTAMLYVMFSFLNKFVYSQVRVAKGRMDILVMTSKTVFVMELKLNGRVDEALRQIDDRSYSIPWQSEGRRVVKVGINFSTKERTIEKWKSAEA